MNSRASGRSALLGLSLAVLALARPVESIRAASEPALAGPGEVVDRGAFLAPPIDVRPSIRWWWPGGDVDDLELARELRAIRDAGFGSAEIQSFAVGLPADAPAAVQTYGTSTWFDHVAAAVDEAHALGLKIDLTLGSAWPSGGAHIGDHESLQQLTSTGAMVTGPGVLDVPFPAPTEPVSYRLSESLLKLPNTFVASKMTPVAVFAVKLSDDQTSEYPVIRPLLPGLPPLAPPVYLDPSSVVDLGPHVNGERIRWPVPTGSWVVFAFYNGPTGSRLFYGADAGPDLVLDHLSQPAVETHLRAVAQAAADRLGPRFGTTLRSIFVDSLELRTELYWTDDLLPEFAARRGYRLEPFLPVVFRPFDADAYLRNLYRNAPPTFEMRDVGPDVRYDYDRTVSELMIERFFTTVGRWAADHGVGARMQAHGAPVDLIQAYGQASTPETEGLYAGGRPDFLKVAASAAHLQGAVTVSSEVLALRGGNATPNAILREANKHFAAGVNQLVLHGFPYVYTTGFGTPGWAPFDSPFLPARDVIGTFGTRLNDTNPFWRFMPAINQQLARAQLVLRMGRPVVNAALYRNRLGHPDDATEHLAVNHELARSGQNYDYVNADALARATVENATLRIGQNTYKALVFDNVTRMPLDIATRVADLASAGLPVVFVGDVPFEGLGYLDALRNTATVRALFEEMFGTTREALKAQRSVRLRSAVFIAAAADLGATLAGGLEIAPDLILSDDRDDIQFAHRQTASADYYFLTSSRSVPFDTIVSFPNAGGRTPLIFDLSTGEVTVAPVYAVRGDRTVMPVHLDAGSAVVVGFEPVDGLLPASLEATDIPFLTRNPDGTLLATALHPGIYRITRNGETVNVRVGGPTLAPVDLPIWDLVTLSQTADGQVRRQEFPRIVLGDLSAVPQLAGFTGTAIYSVLANVGADYLGPGVRVFLDLRQVFDTAEVRVNDRAVTTLLRDPFHVDITRYLKAGVNRIEVGITPGSAPAGLIGPARLVPAYQATLDGLAPVTVSPLPFSTVVSPPHFPGSTNEDMITAIGRAATVTNHVNFQWFWKTPPSPAAPGGGAVVGCAQVGPWVAEARRLGLGVTLQFQTFVTELTTPHTPPNVRIANPVMPFEIATFGNPELRAAYLKEIACLAGLEPDYLVLGPEMNFVVTYNFVEFERFGPVYRKAYDIVKSVSPRTQIGLSWQYDGLRKSMAVDTWGYIPLVGPQDFIGLTTYFGYSDDRFLEHPTVASIPADYYRPIRERFGPDTPVVLTEVGYPTVFPNGLANQADFLERLPALLQEVRPVVVTWALLHDVDYFVGPTSSLNTSGMLFADGTPKPVWDRAQTLASSGALKNVIPDIYNPPAMPFTVSANAPNLPTTFSEEAALAAIGTAGQVTGHISLQFSWKDWVTGHVWECAGIQKYADEARRLGLRFTLQFNTYAVLPPNVTGGNPRVVLLNPIHPPVEDQDPATEPGMHMPDIREAYVKQVACLAGLRPDYLVLGPEVNFIVGARPAEFFEFTAAYQEAYALAKSVSPETQISVSYQYDGVRRTLLDQSLAPEARFPWYIPLVGPQDYFGLTTYFSYSSDAHDEYPEVTDVPSDYYAPIRELVGPDKPVVFTEVGWPSYFAHGPGDQVRFLNRLPSLLQRVKPANVIWALQHDVFEYFPADFEPLNHLGLREVDGSPKVAWHQALRLKDMGLYVTPRAPQ